MALIDLYSHATGLISSTLTQDDLTAVSIGASATLASSTTITRGLSSYGVTAYTGASSVVSYGERDWGSNKATIYAVLYVRFTAVPGAVTSYFSITDSTPNHIIDLRVSAAGAWSVYNYGDTTTYTSTSGCPVIAGVWYRIELKLYCHASNGTIDVKVNGVLEPGISALSSKNTRPGGDARRFRFGVTVAQANAGARVFNDIGIDDADWLGRFYIKPLMPYTAPTDNWSTDASSTHQSQVDHPWTSTINSDMIYSSTASQEEHFGYPTVATTAPTAWHGVVPLIRHRRNVAGSAAGVTLYIRSNSIDGTSSGALDSGGTTAVTSRGALQLTDPNTGAAWAVAGLNAMRLKFVKDAGANRENIGADMIYVAFSSSAAVSGSAGSKGTVTRHNKYFKYDGYYKHRNKPMKGMLV